MKSSTSFVPTVSPSSELVWTNAVAVTSDSSSCAVAACFSRRRRKEGAYRYRRYEFRKPGEDDAMDRNERNRKICIPGATPAACIRGLGKRASSLQKLLEYDK
jgi:hypothetical protein